MGALDQGSGDSDYPTPLAAFLEAKKAKETEKATQWAVTNCGRAGFRINAGACRDILDSF